MERKVVLNFRKLYEEAGGGDVREKCIVSMRINLFLNGSSYILAVFMYLILNSFCHFE